eukprot:jgi/Botrbrau1/5345/Bobra.0346s0019.1
MIDGQRQQGKTGDFGSMNARLLARSVVVHGSTETMEQEYLVWSKRRRLTLDLLLMTMTLASSVTSSYFGLKGVPANDQFSVLAAWIGALSSASIWSIIFNPDLFVACRDYIMAAMWYLLAFSALNYSPLLLRGLQEANNLKAFVSICCVRCVAIVLVSLAWRVPVSWAPSVSFGAVFVSACGALHNSWEFEEYGRKILYIQSICDKLNTGFRSLCRWFWTGTWAAFLKGGAEDFLQCDQIRVTPRHTVLFIWLVTHLLSFWLGFWLNLVDEISDRKAFLAATRRGTQQHIRPWSAAAMMLHMLGVQMFMFTMLLFFGIDVLQVFTAVSYRPSM